MMKTLLAALFILGTTFIAFSQPIYMESEKEGVWIKDGNQKVFFYQK